MAEHEVDTRVMEWAKRFEGERRRNVAVAFAFWGSVLIAFFGGVVVGSAVTVLVAMR